METNEHFVSEGLKDFEVEGQVFKYKPVTAGEETDWLNEYMVQDEEGKIKPDLAKVNKCKIRNLKEVPYDKELIGKLLGVAKDWSDLNNNQKWNLLRKLKPTILSKIIKEINKIDKPTEKKN